MDDSIIAVWTFWISAGFIAYAYAGFPLVVGLRSLWKRSISVDPGYCPQVSVIIAAHNEANDIVEKIVTLLEVEYPAHLLEIIVGSDGSTDDTEQLVAATFPDRVRLLRLPRRGKAATLNSAVACASGEILVFTDANSRFAPSSLRNLVLPLSDPHVGGVAGNQVYAKGTDGASTAGGERAYWNLDRWLKLATSRFGHATSATGALYAIRRELFRAVPEGVTDDFVTSTQVIAQGRRLAFAPDALVYEPVAKSSGAEFGRKVRVMTRGLRGVWIMRRLLNPLRYGFYSVQLFSHKVLRRLVAVPLILLFLASMWLYGQGGIYRFAFAGQAAWYGLAALGPVISRGGRLSAKVFAVPMFFCIVNAASLVAVLNVLRGHRIVVWEPTRANTVLSAGEESA